MSSSIPIRRTTRSAKATIDAENETTKRITTRKTVAAGVTKKAAPVLTRATASTTVAKAKSDAQMLVAGKRKREVLVEVTKKVANNRVKEATEPSLKGKGKEVEAAKAPLKPKVITKPVTRVAPVRRSTRTSTGSKEAEDNVVDTAAAHPAAAPIADRPRVFVPPSSKAVATQKVINVADSDERVVKKRHLEAATAAHPDESQVEADRIAAELVKVEEHETEQDWDDLDEADMDDPLMVSEYAVEVSKYWKEIELSTMPNPEYMKFQTELSWDHRGVLIDWLIQVHAKFMFVQETLFLAINVLDRFLSTRPTSLLKLQLVGITCFMIASKFEEMYTPSVAEIAYLTDGQYKVEDILKAEQYILRTIDWNLRAPGPMGWLRRGSKADDCEPEARTLAKYLLEVAMLEWKLIGTVPSLIAATALWLARLMLGREEWTPNLRHYMTFAEEELISTANIILEYVVMDPIPHESLYKKYAHKRNLRGSVLIRRWALSRWPENANVDLREDLGHIKSELKKRRLAGEAAEEGL